METVEMVAFLADLTSVIMNQVSFALRKSAQQDQEKQVEDQSGDVKTQKSIFLTTKGGLALVLMVLAALLHIAALAHADLTLLSCNASAGIVANVFISTRFLGERFDPKYDTIGLLLISIGCTVIVLLSNKEKQDFKFGQLNELLTSTQSIVYFGLTVVVTNSAKLAGPYFIDCLRDFEVDCVVWDNKSQNHILDEHKGERPERELIQVLNALSIDQVKEVSPDSVALKKYVKLPLLLFLSAAAMMVSLSDLSLKLAGAVIEEAKEMQDYARLLPLIACIVYTVSQTLAFMNDAMKYYDQLEVMPIYQTNIMIWSIVVGMVCFNEIRFYQQENLAGIALATVVCIIGITCLLQKTKVSKVKKD